MDAVKPETSVGDARFGWLTPEALSRVRGVLLALTLFVGLAVYVFHSLGAVEARDGQFMSRLQGVGVLTWLYALAQDRKSVV